MSGPPPAIAASTRRRDRNRVERSGVDAALVDGTIPHPHRRVELNRSCNRAHRGKDCIGIPIAETADQHTNSSCVARPEGPERFCYRDIVSGALLGAQACGAAVPEYEFSHQPPAPAATDHSMEHGAVGTSANRSIRNFAAAPPYPSISCGPKWLGNTAPCRIGGNGLVRNSTVAPRPHQS